MFVKDSLICRNQLNLLQFSNKAFKITMMQLFQSKIIKNNKTTLQFNCKLKIPQYFCIQIVAQGYKASSMQSICFNIIKGFASSIILLPVLVKENI